MDATRGVIEAVMAWAEGGLDRPLSVEAMARHAGYSLPHFSRAFAAVAGESPAGGLTGRRVVAAMRRLADSDARVVDIALACGFDDATTFTRAFRRRTGVTPSAFRRERAARTAVGPKVQIGERFRAEALTLVGLSADVAADPAAPGRLWQRLGAEIERLALSPAPEDFRQVAYWRDDPTDLYTCIAGFRTVAEPALPLPFVRLSIQAATCRRFIVDGPVEQLPRAYATVFAVLLPGCGDRLAGDYVIECPRPDGEGTEIWVPVEG